MRYIIFVGVRSLSFKEDILTIGTGVGRVLFFDVRGGKYIETECGQECSLKVGKGWLVSLKHLIKYMNISR